MDVHVIEEAAWGGAHALLAMFFVILGSHKLWRVQRPAALLAIAAGATLLVRSGSRVALTWVAFGDDLRGQESSSFDPLNLVLELGGSGALLAAAAGGMTITSAILLANAIGRLRNVGARR